MTLADDIKAACQTAVTELADSGWSWGTAVDGPWVALAVVATGTRRQYEDGESSESDYQAMQVRVSDAAAIPVMRNYLKDPDDNSWIITEVLSGAGGTTAYGISRAIVETLGNSRGRTR